MRLPTAAVLVLAAARWTAAASVAYRADDALFAAHVETQVLSGKVAVYAVEKEKRYSEEKTAYLVYFAANTKKEGPWESSAFIVGPPGAARLKVRFKDHASYEPVFRWLGEKWLFVRLWIGRAVALEMIFDLERGAIVEKTVADHTALLAAPGEIPIPR